ncbi:MAG: transposase [Halobacteriales archaeon]|nr:transposase [Halobacteriales archaeon]
MGATDSTGYSNKPRPWSETDFGLRAHENWLKDHSVVDTEHLVYLNLPTLTPGKVHDSRMFAKAWARIPEEANVTLFRSLADAAYSGMPCLEAAREHGATPFHAIRKDARHTATPETLYEKLVNFAKHWPNRFADLTTPRGLVETVFFLTKQRFGHQLRCRSDEGRWNEIRAKRVSHNVRIILLRQVLSAA